MFETERFINEIEKRPALYNTKLKEYANRDIKAALWEEVAKEMYCDWEDFCQDEKNKRCKELQVKWKSIRDHFKKEVTLEKKLQCGLTTKKKKKYIYYDQLSFLHRYIDNRPTSKFEQGEINTYNPLEANINERIPPRKRATRRPHNDLSEIKDITKILNQNIGLQRQDVEADPMGNRAFLMSLLPMMNIMHPNELIQLRFKMMELFNMYHFASNIPTFANRFTSPP